METASTEFYDISPSTDKRVCQNCRHFEKWGVYMGTCSIIDENVGEDYVCEDFWRNENKES